MKKFFSEFKDFIMRGNVMDLAVAVIVGAAFQAIISSLVDDVLSPFIGIFVNLDFKDLVFTLNGVDIRYGAIYYGGHYIFDHGVCYIPADQGNK